MLEFVHAANTVRIASYSFVFLMATTQDELIVLVIVVIVNNFLHLASHISALLEQKIEACDLT